MYFVLNGRVYRNKVTYGGQGEKGITINPHIYGDFIRHTCFEKVNLKHMVR